MEIVKQLLPFWPCVAIVLIVGVLGQTLKHRAKFIDIYWLRRIFPVILLALGGVVGSIWPGELVPGVVETVPKVFAGVGSAAFSIAFFDAVKSYVKTKYKIEVRRNQRDTND